MNVRAPMLVGLVLLAAAAGLSWFVLTTNKDTFSDAATYPLYADFTDASGIRGKTRVQANGIDIGKISSIQHVRDANGRLTARVTLRIGNDYAVYADAEVRKAAESLLGDFRIDLDPGSPGARKLASGEGITDVHSLSDIDEIKGQLLHVAQNVNKITESFSSVLSGPAGAGSLRSIMNKLESSMAAIESTTRALQHTIVGNDKVIEQIIQDVGRVTGALAEVSAPGGDLLTVSHNLARISAKVDHMADTVGELLGATPAGSAGVPADTAAGKEVASLRTTLEDLGDAIHNISDITRKVDEGQGTLGRVVNDPGIAERVEETLDSANQIIGSIAHLETRIELRSEYDVPFKGTNSQIQPAVKNIVGLRILPKPDKFYIIEAVSDPRGRQTRTLTTTAINGATISSDESVISFNDLKFSAEFAKRYYFATLRFGIIENTGGLGVDVHFLDEKAEIRFDAFDFSRRNPRNLEAIFPRARVTGMYELANHIVIQGGFDDPFNSDLRVWFMGGVLRFTDDDLKGLLAIAPTP
jgi:phospholipid/cholesterol/gamma-HCH transport system substrate-binding protein